LAGLDSGKRCIIRLIRSSDREKTAGPEEFLGEYLTALPGHGSGINFTTASEVLMGSVIKKRRKKMRKHKHKKLRAKQRHKNK
jgi:hypothetical protein